MHDKETESYIYCYKQKAEIHNEICLGLHLTLDEHTLNDDVDDDDDDDDEDKTYLKR